VASLQAAINVMGIYQTTTYTYLKECPTYVIGYGTGIQIIQLPCLYGGIRDVGAYLYGNPEHANLFAYIFGVAGQGNLGAYIKSTIQASQDLGASVRGFIQEYKNLIAAIKIIRPGSKDLLALLTGELNKGHDNLQALLDIIEIRDLPASLVGELLKGQADLGAGYDKLFLREHIGLSAYISSVMTPNDLPAILNVIAVDNLTAFLRTFQTSLKDLQAYLNTIQITNLLASIHGLDTRALGATLAGVYGPYDMQAYLNATGGYKDLLVAYIKGMAGTKIPIDLRGIVEGMFSLNLSAYITSISPVNLLAYLNVVGQTANLLASIVPRIIHLKQAVRVSLLEHLDLHAMVNFACFTSDHRNLGAYLYPIMKLDLRAVIFGWHVNIYSNVKDLALYINTGVYSVEDRIPIGFCPTQPDLSAVVTGILESLNLNAYIKPVFDWNYSELPADVNPKTHEIVIDFSVKWRENWRKFVELMFDNFGDSPYHYFYVSGASQVYRVDRDRHWIIRAKSYRRTDSIIERRSVRYKYVFKMSAYANVDEAVRDLIDRVSAYRRVSLGASITGGFGPTDLRASINGILDPRPVRSWVKYLHASITGTGGFFNLSTTITGIP
jgi:hypothetical protein